MFPNALFDKINDDIKDYDIVFDKLMLWLYFITLPIGCLLWFRLNYLPVIWNKFFGQAAHVQFTNADPSWGFWYTCFYNFIHPPMYMAVYFNSCTDSGVWWFFILPMPCFIIVYSVLFAIIMAILYRTIWDKVIGPTIGDYLRPIVDSACRNVKR